MHPPRDRETVNQVDEHSKVVVVGDGGGSVTKGRRNATAEGERIDHWHWIRELWRALSPR
jgi:hypothetical protein